MLKGSRTRKRSIDSFENAEYERAQPSKTKATKPTIEPPQQVLIRAAKNHCVQFYAYLNNEDKVMLRKQWNKEGIEGELWERMKAFLKAKLSATCEFITDDEFNALIDSVQYYPVPAQVKEMARNAVGLLDANKQCLFQFNRLLKRATKLCTQFCLDLNANEQKRFMHFWVEDGKSHSWLAMLAPVKAILQQTNWHVKNDELIDHVLLNFVKNKPPFGEPMDLREDGESCVNRVGF